MKMKIAVSVVYAMLVFVSILPSSIFGKAVDFEQVSEKSETFSGIEWWPMFRHDLGRTGFSISDAPDTNNLRWSYLTETGKPVKSSPAVVDNVVFAGCYDGYVYAVWVVNGTLKWRSPKLGDYVHSSPTVASGMVFVGSSDGKVYALNQDSGAISWSSPLLGSAVESSPAVADSKVFVGSNNGTVYALNQQTGLVIWKNTTTAEKPVKSSPAVVDGVVYVGSFDGYVYSYNMTDGNLLNKYETGDEIESSPVVVDGVVYVGSRDRNVYAFNASDGSEKWEFLSGARINSSPAVAYGMVFIGSWDKKVYALNASTGDPIWNNATNGNVESSPAVADGKIFIGSNDGKLYAFDNATGSVVWSRLLGIRVCSSPAVVSTEIGSMVFIGCDDGKIYAFGSSNQPPQPSFTFSPENPDISVTVKFDASASYDPDGSIVKYEWNFGDGKKGEGKKCSHIYAVAGEYPVTLRVTDDFSTAQSNSTVKMITVLDAWPMFHHYPSHAGYSASGAPITVNKAWEFLTSGAVKSSPAVVDGVVYFGSEDGYIYAVNITNGEQIWRRETLQLEPVISSPAIADGIVFIGCDDTRLYAINATTGNVLWNKPTGGCVHSSPAVAYGKVFVGSQDNNVYAFNATTGDIMWTYPTKGDVNSVPAVNEGIVYVSAFDIGGGKIYALNASTGAWIWEYPTWGPVISSPAVAGGKLIVGSNDGNVTAISLADGSVIWKTPFKDGSVVKSSPAVAYGLVFVGANDGYVYALREVSGEIVWKYRIGRAIGLSSPAVVEAGGRGLVLVGSQDGKLYALSKNGGLYWSYQTGSAIESSPAVLHGMIFVGSNDGKLYAFREIPDYTAHDVSVILRVGYCEPYVFEPCKSVVGQPLQFSVYVAVENQGTFTETFNVTLHALSVGEIGRQFVTDLAPASTRLLTFYVNTSDFAIGNQYVISAEADAVPEETDIADNKFTIGWMVITIPGDIDGNYCVELADLVWLSKAYCSRPGDFNWNPNADIDNNGHCGLSDLVRLAQHYGQHCP